MTLYDKVPIYCCILIIWLRCKLNWIFKGYIPADGVKGLPCCLSMPLPPHELVQIRWELVFVASFHPFELRLDSAPVALDIVRVHACYRILKVQRVVHCMMRRHSGQRGHIIICSPLVTVDLCARTSVPLDNRE